MTMVLEDLHRYEEAMDHAKQAFDIGRNAFGSENYRVKHHKSLINRLRGKL
jgi:hypothetical protein